MKKLILIVLFTNVLFAEYMQDVLSNTQNIKVWSYDSPQCYGTDENYKYKLFVLELSSTTPNVKYTNYFTSSNKLTFPDKAYNGYYCATNSFIDDSSSLGSKYNIYYNAESNDPLNTDNLPRFYIKYKVTDIEDVTPTCQENPDLTTINGFTYQGATDSEQSCQSMYNDEGDGNGFYFSNPNLDPLCGGFCYYNLPTNDPDPIPTCQEEPTHYTMSGLEYQGKFSTELACETSYSNNGDSLGFLFSNPNLDSLCDGFCYYNLPDDTNIPPDDVPDDNPSTGEEVTVADVIPYIDELENKNEAIRDSLENLNTNLNTQFSNINNNNTTLTNTISNIDTTLQNLDNTLENLSNTDNSDSNDNYDGVTDGFEVNPDISSELSTFRNDIENKIENSFSSYSDVFGLGGFGSIPAPITLNVLGHSYTLFDLSVLNPYVQNIRNIFLISAYIFGLFLIFRGD